MIATGVQQGSTLSLSLSFSLSFSLSLSLSRWTYLKALLKIYWFDLPGQSNPAVGFSANLSKDTYLGDSQAIKYDGILSNFGNGYDKWSGHFKAPIKGLYVFSCTVMAKYTGDISVSLMKNGHPMSTAYSAVAPWESGAISIVLGLQKGDKVWIRRNGHGRTIHGIYNWFSGYLISTRV